MRKTVWNDFWSAIRARFKKPKMGHYAGLFAVEDPRRDTFRPIIHSDIRFNRLYIGKRGYRYRLPKMKQVRNFRVPLPC
jgi:hypothetical protein